MSLRGAQAPSDNLADLMTTIVQPRHVKLAFAGREKLGICCV
jgi:hypothetical protein